MIARKTWHIVLAVVLACLSSTAVAGKDIKICSSAPPNVYNGNFPTSCRGAASGAVCTAACKDGYSSTPLPTTTCKNGIWSAPTAKCLPSVCKGAPAAVHHGNWPAGCHDAAPGTTCTAICDMNSLWWYNKKGLPKSTCKPDGKWSNPDPDNCEKQLAQGCVGSPSAPHSDFNCGTTSPVGAPCTATCAVGFRPASTGAPTATCKGTPTHSHPGFSGPITWSAVTGECTPVCLGNPTQPSHGTFTCNSPTNPGDVCSATCASGYRGAPTATCQADGTYSAVTGTCDLSQCSGNPASTDHGTFACASPALPGTTCTATCADGHRGAPTATCGPDGAYGPVAGGCQLIECSGNPLNQPSNSSWECASPAVVGSVCNGTCDNGYTGTPSASCQADGTYSDVDGNCTAVPTECNGNPTNPPVGTEWECAAHTAVGDDCTGFCSSGYTGAASAICQSDGTFTVTNSCTATPPGCTQTPVPLFGGKPFTSCVVPAAVGTVCTAGCDPNWGSPINGGPRAVCKADGTWDYGLGMCS